MSVPAPIRTVVFDIGRVLVDFSLDGFSDFLRTHGAEIADLPDFVAKTRMRDYEAGKIPTSDFISGVQKILGRPAQTEEISKRWQEIFRPIPEMLELLDRVSRSHTTHLLSNTNALHWEYLISAYRLDARISGSAVTSFQSGCLKPGAGIYEKIEALPGFSPESTIFIDDIAEHVAAASARGWHGITHTGFESTAEALRKLLRLSAR